MELRPVDAGDSAGFAVVGADGAASSGGASGKEGFALAAIRDIREGEELTFDYGDE